MKNKVYCKNCQFFYRDFINAFCEKILNVNKVKAHDTPVEYIKERFIDEFIYKDYRKYNKNNNCKYYKQKKWWKWLIK